MLFRVALSLLADRECDNLLPPSTAPTTAHRYGFSDATVMILWLKHGTAEHLYIHITPSAPRL